jgi:hypothetical protein
MAAVAEVAARVTAAGAKQAKRAALSFGHGFTHFLLLLMRYVLEWHGRTHESRLAMANLDTLQTWSKESLLCHRQGDHLDPNYHVVRVHMMGNQELRTGMDL